MAPNENRTRDGSRFTKAEKAWLREQYDDPDVQALVQKGEARNAARLITEWYIRDWSGLRPAEDDKAFKKRRHNMPSGKKRLAVRRAEEDSQAMQARIAAAGEVSLLRFRVLVLNTNPFLRLFVGGCVERRTDERVWQNSSPARHQPFAQCTLPR